MDIDITVPARLQLIPVHKKLPVQLLVQFIEDQAPLRRHQRAVRVGIALVSDVANRLALCIDVIHHVDKILFIVPIIPITLGHRRIDLLQSPFRDIVHILNVDSLFSQGPCALLGKPADILCLFISELVKDPCSRFIDRIHDLFHIEILSGAVLLDHVQLAFLLLYVVFLFSSVSRYR